MVGDILSESKKRLGDAKPKSAGDIRALKAPVVEFSDAMKKNDKELKEFLFNNMYRHYKLNRMTAKARRVVGDLFDLFLRDPACLPDEWSVLAGDPMSEQTARLVADYIAGMTDRFALDEHSRLFDIQAKTSDVSIT